MGKFIELTVESSKRPILVNTDQVMTVSPTKEGGLGATLAVAYPEKTFFLHVLQTYEEVRDACLGTR